MILEELKNQVSALMETFGPMTNTMRNKQLINEDSSENVRKIVRVMTKDLNKGCWFLLFNRLTKAKGFVIVEIKATKSVFYSTHFEAFYQFCTKDVEVQS